MKTAGRVPHQAQQAHQVAEALRSMAASSEIYQEVPIATTGSTLSYVAAVPGTTTYTANTLGPITTRR